MIPRTTFYDRTIFLINRMERSSLLIQQPDIITTGIEEVTSTAKPVFREIRRFPKRVKKLIEMLPQKEVHVPFLVVICMKVVVLQLLYLLSSCHYRHYNSSLSLDYCCSLLVGGFYNSCEHAWSFANFFGSVCNSCNSFLFR